MSSNINLKIGVRKSRSFSQTIRVNQGDKIALILCPLFLIQAFIETIEKEWEEVENPDLQFIIHEQRKANQKANWTVKLSNINILLDDVNQIRYNEDLSVVLETAQKH
jgi:hypothetical protein